MERLAHKMLALIRHINSMSPYLALSKIIKLTGEYPKHVKFLWDKLEIMRVTRHRLPDMDVIFHLTSLKMKVETL